MKRLAIVLGSIVLVVFFTVASVQGAPKSTNGLLSRITDAILGYKNLPKAFEPLVQDEIIASLLPDLTGPIIANNNIDLDASKVNFSGHYFVLEDDASVIGFHDARISNFKLKSGLGVTKDNFFQLYRNDLKLSNNNQMHEIRSIEQIKQTALTTIHYQHSTFEQLYKGVPVLGAHFILHERNGEVASGNGNIAPNLDMEVTPSVSMEQARDTALGAIDAEVYSWQSSACQPGGDGCIPLDNGGWDCPDGGSGEPDVPTGWCDEPQGKLNIMSKGWEMQPDSFALVWIFDINTATPRNSYKVYIDAGTGSVLDVSESNLFISGTNVPCQGNTLYNGLQSFLATQVNDGYYYLTQMREDLLQRPLYAVLDADDYGEPPPDPEGDNIDGQYRTPNDGTCMFDDPGDVLGVSVMWGLEKCWDFYKQYDWFGVDGAGVDDMVAYIHYDPALSSFYDPNLNLIFYCGTIDDKSREMVDLLSISHEYTHAVMDHMVPNLMQQPPEALMLQEGIADAISVAVEAFALGEPPDWCIGEERRLTGQCITDLSNPDAWGEPDTYLGQNWIPVPLNANGFPLQKCTPGDNDWCHKNGTLISHWFYLLTEGGQGVNDNGSAYYVLGVDLYKAVRILLGAIYHNLSPMPNFEDLRYGTIDSAKVLYGDNAPEVKSVMNAWAAVGVGEAYDDGTYNPANGTPNVPAWPAKIRWAATSGTSQTVLISLNPTFDKAYVISTQNETPMLVLPGSSQSSVFDVVRSVEVNLRPDWTYYWKVFTAASSSGGGGGGSGGGWFVPWLMKLVHMDSTGGSDAGPGYVVPPQLTDGTMSPLRYFKTSSMRTETVAPTSIGWVHPWQVTFSVKQLPGAHSIFYQLKDDAGDAIVNYTADASVVDSVDHTVSTVVDLKVNHHYTWSAYATGPVVADMKIPGSITMRPSGKVSGWSDLWTSTPRSELHQPAAGAEVQPHVYFSWEPIKGIDSSVGNGAYYKLLVSKYQDLSNPVAMVGDLTTAEYALDVPPLSDAGIGADYYWNVLPVGPDNQGNESGLMGTTRHFYVDASATKPVGVYPSGDEFPYNSTIVGFVWSPVANADSYVISVYHQGTSQLAATIPVTQMTTIQSGTSAGMLRAESWQNMSDATLLTQDLMGYCWEVSGVFDGVKGIPSNRLCYGIGGSKPTLIMPVNGTEIVKSYSGPIGFIWDAVHAPNGYSFTVWNSTACSVGTDPHVSVIISDGNVKSYAALENVHYTGYYSWKVCTLKPNGTDSSCSSCSTFRVNLDKVEDDTPGTPDNTCALPGKPTLTYPEEGGVDTNTNLPASFTAQWNPVNGADYYYYQLYASGATLDADLVLIDEESVLFNSAQIKIDPNAWGYYAPFGYVLYVWSVNSCDQASLAPSTAWFYVSP
jgi:Zn-dependent metalloprotease